MSAREAVARAIFCTSRPGHRWSHQPPEVLEYWGNLADAALGQVAQVLAAPETEAAFKVSWEAADERGEAGSRVKAGLDTVARILTGRRS